MQQVHISPSKPSMQWTLEMKPIPPTKNGEKTYWWRGFMDNPKIDFNFSILHAYNFDIFFNKLEIRVNW